MNSNLKILALATFLLFAVSCEEDDVLPGDEERAILTNNEWILITIEGHHYDNWDPIDFTEDDLIVEQNTLNGLFLGSTWNFNSDGTFTYFLYAFQETVEGTWEYSVEFENMTITTTSEENFFDIEISSTQLVIYDRIEGATNVSEYVATYIPN